MTVTLAMSLMNMFGKPVAERLIKSLGDRKAGPQKLETASAAVAQGASVIEALKKTFGADFLLSLNEALGTTSARFSYEAGTQSYIRLDATDKSPTSVLRDELNINLDQLYRIRIAPKFGHKALSSINRRETQVFHNALLFEGLSPASADHHIKLLRRVLNLAVQWELLDKNPLKGIPLLMVNNEVENYLDEDQTQALLEVLKTDANRSVGHILMFLISTGARLNEALTATWKNVSIEGGVWKVDATRSKSKKVRSIPLNDSALWVLEQLASKGRSEYLFPSPVKADAGKDEPYLTITRAWYRIRKLAGVDVRIHDLRHGFASRLVCKGRSLYEVQQILGHSDPKVTMRYAHLSSKALQEAANAGSVIVPKVPPKTQAAEAAKAA